MNIYIPYSNQISKFSFIIFMVITFFGTSIPFQSRMQDIGADEIGSSNIINQIVYPILFLLSFIAFIPKTQVVFKLIKKEKFFFTLLIFALISILWSSFPIISLKRWFQIFTYYFVIVVFITYVRSEYELLETIKPVLLTYIFISIVVVLIIPAAKDPEFGSWRGLASQKNHLGQIALVSFILSIIMYKRNTEKRHKYLLIMAILISFTLAIGTISSTIYSVLALFIIASIIFYFNENVFSKIGVTYFILIVSTFTIVLLTIIILLFEPNAIDYFQGIFGKEGGFSDRDRLWQAILFNASNHLIFGGGFQGFWIIESPQIQLLHSSFLYLPIQAHNGYLDILNDMGIVGLLLFFILITYYFLNLFKKKDNIWSWFIILPLIINITETTFFRTGHITFIFFILAYLFSFSKFTNENYNR